MKNTMWVEDEKRVFNLEWPYRYECSRNIYTNKSSNGENLVKSTKLSAAQQSGTG